MPTAGPAPDLVVPGWGVASGEAAGETVPDRAADGEAADGRVSATTTPAVPAAAIAKPATSLRAPLPFGHILTIIDHIT